MWIAGLLARWGVKEAMATRLAPWVAGGAFVAILGLLAWLLMGIADRWHENTIAVATEAGAASAVAAGHEQTLDQLEDANNAEQDLRRAGERDAGRYADCLRNGRDKARCERFNPAGK